MRRTWQPHLFAVGFAVGFAALGVSDAIAQCPPVECASAPCVTLQAVVVNGQPILPTNCPFVRSGDLIRADLFVSGWGEALPAGVRGCEFALFTGPGAASGSSGTILPVGWDSPIVPIYCMSDGDCTTEYPTCNHLNFCVGPDHDPEIGAFIDTSHPEFLFAGHLGIYEYSVQILARYRFLGLLIESIGIQDDLTPKYTGSLMLRVSEDASGVFEFPFDSDPDPAWSASYFADPAPKPNIAAADWVPLVVHVCEDDGIFCNGLETFDPETGCVAIPPDCNDNNDCTTDSCNETTDSCDHVPACGACCDSWIGECRDAVDSIDCVCTNCIWTGGADCAAVGCEAQFVAIPAVSDWGLVILSLTLLIVAKIRFGRANAEPV
jgi:hypothetical protein